MISLSLHLSCGGHYAEHFRLYSLLLLAFPRGCGNWDSPITLRLHRRRRTVHTIVIDRPDSMRRRTRPRARSLTCGQQQRQRQGHEDLRRACTWRRPRRLAKKEQKKEKHPGKTTKQAMAKQKKRGSVQSAPRTLLWVPNDSVNLVGTLTGISIRAESTRPLHKRVTSIVPGGDREAADRRERRRVGQCGRRRDDRVGDKVVDGLQRQGPRSTVSA